MGGENHGSITTAFDQLTGGALQTIGCLLFSSLGADCMGIIESSLPFATHVVSCTQAVTNIPIDSRGKVCVGYGGYDACEGDWGPVEPGTWGNIKSQHR